MKELSFVFLGTSLTKDQSISGFFFFLVSLIVLFSFVGFYKIPWSNLSEQKIRSIKKSKKAKKKNKKMVNFCCFRKAEQYESPESMEVYSQSTSESQRTKKNIKCWDSIKSWCCQIFCPPKAEQNESPESMEVYSQSISDSQRTKMEVVASGSSSSEIEVRKGDEEKKKEKSNTSNKLNDSHKIKEENIKSISDVKNSSKTPTKISCEKIPSSSIKKIENVQKIVKTNKDTENAEICLPHRKQIQVECHTSPVNKVEVKNLKQMKADVTSTSLSHETQRSKSLQWKKSTEPQKGDAERRGNKSKTIIFQEKGNMSFQKVNEAPVHFIQNEKIIKENVETKHNFEDSFKKSKVLSLETTGEVIKIDEGSKSSRFNISPEKTGFKKFEVLPLEATEKVIKIDISPENQAKRDHSNENLKQVQNRNKKMKTEEFIKSAQKSKETTVEVIKIDEGRESSRFNISPEKTGFKKQAKRDRSNENLKQVQNRRKKIKIEESIKSNQTPFPKGLENLGNTCFFNSVFQNLYQTQILGNLFKDCPGANKSSLIKSMNRFYSGSPSLQNILQAIRSLSGKFYGNKQEDSHELLRQLCQCLMKEERSLKGNSQEIETQIESVFKGHTITTFLCSKCHKADYNIEKFMDLSLPVSFKLKEKEDANSAIFEAILKNDGIKDEKTRKIIKLSTRLSKLPNHHKSTNITIEDCLTFFTKQDVSIPYLCQECYKEDPTIFEEENRMPQGLMRTLIVDLPPVLVVHLKRFKQTFDGRFKKCNDPVVYKQALDLGPFCSKLPTQLIPSYNQSDEGKILYGLYGIVVHSGSMDGGHYVAYVKCREDRTEKIKEFVKNHQFNEEIKNFVENRKFNEEEVAEGWQKVDVTRSSNLEAKSTHSLDDESWFFTSDSTVTKVAENEVFRQQAYLLFYETLAYNEPAREMAV